MEGNVYLQYDRKANADLQYHRKRDTCLHNMHNDRKGNGYGREDLQNDREGNGYLQYHREGDIYLQNFLPRLSGRKWILRVSQGMGYIIIEQHEGVFTVSQNDTKRKGYLQYHRERDLYLQNDRKGSTYGMTGNGMDTNCITGKVIYTYRMTAGKAMIFTESQGMGYIIT
ncbi:unnamed protein product [Mytilus coruscus]|uniref:Uncharacterized protein n=1 Tax=Mytilus coruscus TaxID=42192 RepID=A0A6J8D7Y4_MYTCO|nr:unnamed protein product [Mytilus coruscus]